MVLELVVVKESLNCTNEYTADSFPRHKVQKQNSSHCTFSEKKQHLHYLRENFDSTKKAIASLHQDDAHCTKFMESAGRLC